MTYENKNPKITTKSNLTPSLAKHEKNTACKINGTQLPASFLFYSYGSSPKVELSTRSNTMAYNRTGNNMMSDSGRKPIRAILKCREFYLRFAT